MPKVIIHKKPGAPGDNPEVFENAYVADGEMKKEGEFVIVREKGSSDAIAFVPRAHVAKVVNDRD